MVTGAFLSDILSPRNPLSVSGRSYTCKYRTSSSPSFTFLRPVTPVWLIYIPADIHRGTDPPAVTDETARKHGFIFPVALRRAEIICIRAEQIPPELRIVPQFYLLPHDVVPASRYTFVASAINSGISMIFISPAPPSRFISSSKYCCNCRTVFRICPSVTFCSMRRRILRLPFHI